MDSREKDHFEVDIEGGVKWNSNMVKSGVGNVDDDDVELVVIEKRLGGDDTGDREADVEKICVVGEMHKKNARKPPKPPRPPKGPSILDAADRKLVRELSELAMRKSARVERIKALKKIKVAKASPLNNSGLSAMVITLIFFLIITFQGLRSRSSASVRLHGSPEPALAVSEGMISIRYHKDFFVYKRNGPGSISLSFAEEQDSSSGPGNEVGKIAR
ncbi:uncharacterized protein LOC121260509 [Juglans microcarpa x Juglans regia]|uniref:uncharacterized protein LOC121260509 n=1 Tax=Juglans microcarpa x Juglans regia TaxID=2249226 RepID=UPI001B7DE56F|nr:uncharacterized protein LOC121260509 [Juglans microcarpa x Juglans regia]